MDNNSRQQEHKKNLALEKVFPEMERLLGEAEKVKLQEFTAPKFPIFLIIGAARSGTTLIYQYLAQTGFFSYPTNLISRFYYAPYIGARIQQILIDFDIKGEIFPKRNVNNFSSDLGKTFGPKQPHEFWYFWNRFFQFGEIQQLSEEQKKQVNWSVFKQELAALESVYEKPLLIKAMNLNWNLSILMDNLPKVHFIYIKRDIKFNAQSLYIARKKFFGNVNDWYSFKPPNYMQIKLLEPEQQVVEQVKANNFEIEKQLEKLNAENYTIIDYESFCDSPVSLLKKLSKNSKYQLNLSEIDDAIKFKSGNIQKLDDISFFKIGQYI